MTTIHANAGLEQPDQRPPNSLLRRARLRCPSPSGSGRPMSRQELADAVNTCVFETTGRHTSIDATYVGALERGKHRWPGADYRAALRAVLHAHTDAEIGLYIRRRNAADEAFMAELDRQGG